MIFFLPSLTHSSFDSGITTSLLSSSSSFRLAVAPGLPGNAWGADASVLFLPAGQRLIVGLASPNFATMRTVHRHYAEVRKPK
ncbi:unnamed protein product [Protopolystoma xenopodis]|uniref:Uncharacterized protein n=1 Tax=Protopolystoma xenopodis TaxID=117903 RepID=A0A3S5BE74_9PLAT|nr:unnamed protein product [Protopolystoma xenopodis]